MPEKLLEYYRQLKEYIEELDLAADEPKEPDMELLAPVISYLLASKSCVSQKIQNAYVHAQKKAEAAQPAAKKRTEDLLVRYDMPELESTLTQKGRLRYKQALFCLLSEDGGINREQAAGLLEKAYPDSVLDGTLRDICFKLAVGAYETRDACVTIVLLVLREISFPGIPNAAGGPFWSWAGILKLSALTYMPLPYWSCEPEEEWRGAAKRIERSVGKLANNACYFYTDEAAVDSVKRIRLCVEEDEKKRAVLETTRRCAIAKPPSMEEIMGAADDGHVIGLLPVNTAKKLQQYISDKRVKERKFRVEDMEDPGKRRERLLAEFARSCLSMGPVSIEEIYDTEITEETADRIALAYYSVFYEDENADLAKDPTAMFLASAMMSLANRAYNESRVNTALIEEVSGMKQRLDVLEAVGSCSCCGDNTQDTEKMTELTDTKQEIESLKKEIAALKLKNSGLSEKIKDIREKKGNENAKLRGENEILKGKYRDLKLEMDELLAAMEGGEEADEDGEGRADDNGRSMEMDEMCRHINGNRLIFVGGHDTWQRTMRRFFPDAKFVRKECYSTLSKDSFRNVDYIIYNYKWSEHGIYHKCKSYVGDNGTPILMICSNNTEFSVRKIYDAICLEESNQKAG